MADHSLSLSLKRFLLIAACPPADLTVKRIGDLLDYDLPALLAGQQSVQLSQEVIR